MRAKLTQFKLIKSLIFFSALLFFTQIKAQTPDWISNVTFDVGLDSAHGTRIMIVDVNNDNYPDLLWGTGELIKNRISLYLNIENPDKTSSNKRIFKNITEESGINVNRDSNKTGRYVDVSAMADLDNDGDMDLVTSIYYHRLQMYQGENDPGDRSEVYLNNGNGKFTLLEQNGLYDLSISDTLPSGLINATGLAFLDYDYDGVLDLYISTWFLDYAANLANGGDGHKMKDVLMKGNGDGSFSRINDNAINNIVQPMYGVNVTDWDNDGWQDVITSPYCRSGGSLFKNMQDGSFSNATTRANYSSQKMGGDHGQALCQWEALPADFDCDGDMDLLQVEVHGGNDDHEGRSHISINGGVESGFRYEWAIDRLRRDAPKSTTHFGDMGGAWFDLDADGWLDVAIANMGYINETNQVNTQGQVRLYVLKQNEEGYFDDVSKDVGIYETMKDGHSMEPVDFDLDGDQDLFFSHLVRDTIQTDSVPYLSSHMQIVLLRNDIGNTKNWINMKLLPPDGANKSGVGSRITVCSGNHRQITEVQAALGHIGQQQHFVRNVAIGDRHSIDSIIVRWPKKDLQETVIYNPPLNLFLEIDENGINNIFKQWEDKASLIVMGQALYTFDTVDVGDSKEMTVVVKNIGGEELIISGFELKNDVNGVFEFIGPSREIIIAPGGQSAVHVKFTPLKRAHYYAYIEFTSNAFNGGKTSANIHGYGYDAASLIAIEPDNFSFTDCEAGAEYSKKLTISNYGDRPLEITNADFRGDTENVFSLSDENTFTIQPLESKEIDVVFSPIGKNTFDIELVIISNAYNLPELFIPVSGIADGPISSFKSNKIFVDLKKCPLGEYREKEIEIENSGEKDLEIYDISYGEIQDGVFDTPGMSFPFVVEAGATEPITILFTPKEVVKYSDDMTFSTNVYKDSLKILKIRGQGTDPSWVAGDLGTFTFAISASPNPAARELKITINNNTELSTPTNISISSVTGRNVIEIKDFTLISGINEKVIDISSIAEGMYYLHISSGKNSAFLPIVIYR